MPEYRLYRLDGSGKIEGAPIQVDAKNDDEALILARAKKLPAQGELWQGNRLVAKVSAVL
jgi:hypothetical protein